MTALAQPFTPTHSHAAPALPEGLHEIEALLEPSITRDFGYHGGANWVLFFYDSRDNGVVWDDGYSHGMAPGGWRKFIGRIAPLADKYGVYVGGDRERATHALVIDRGTYSTYFANIDDARRVVGDQRRIFRHVAHRRVR